MKVEIMKLTSENLQELSTIAISAATKAGEFIANYPRQQISVQSKNAGENLASQVVTEVDIRAQEIILTEVSSTIEKFNLGLLTEESIDSGDRFAKEYFWCIDPLDGTLPFTENRSGYSVSIALVSYSGESLIGVVYDPVNENIYSSIKDCGAYRNGKSWKIEKKNDEIFTLVCDRSFLKQPNLDNVMSIVEKIAEQCGSTYRNQIDHGGAAMNAIWVLENAPAIYFKYPKSVEGGGSLWDYAATASIFSELDCIGTDILGNDLDLNRKDSTFMNHCGVLFSSEKRLVLPELLKQISQ